MRRVGKLTWSLSLFTPAVQEFPIQRPETDAVIPSFGDVDDFVLIDENVVGTGNVSPFLKKGALGIENLDAMVRLPVQNDYSTPRVSADTMGQAELARPRAFRSPGMHQITVCGIVMDSMLAISIGYVNVAIG